MDLPTKVFVANEIRIWGAFATAFVGLVSFAAVWAHSRWQAELNQQERAAAAEIKRKSDEKIAGLENEAAQARLEAEKIRKAVAWRALSSEQTQSLLRALSAKPGSVNLRYMDGDPEALGFAIQLSNILAEAKWKIAPGSLKPANTLIFGIALPDSTPDGETLREALKEANINFFTDPIEPNRTAFNVTVIPGAPILMIGSRPVVLP